MEKEIKKHSLQILYLFNETINICIFLIKDCSEVVQDTRHPMYCLTVFRGGEHITGSEKNIVEDYVLKC